MTRQFSLTFRTGRQGEPVTVTGRDAWALDLLTQAGEAGCTPLEMPGPRWSGYVFNLRQMGLAIETVHERHGGLFAGRHARYVLRSNIEVLERADGR